MIDFNALAGELDHMTLSIKVINVERGNYWRCPICNGENAHKDDCIVTGAVAALRHAAVVEKDKERLDWLERQSVTVDRPLRWGHRFLFRATPDVEEETTDLRARIDAACSPE